MVLDPAEVPVLDANAAFLGVATSTLMRNAGDAVAKAVEKRFNPKRVVVVCGTGNNGGDGLVCAVRLHHKGVEVSCVLAGSAKHLRRLEARDAYDEATRLKIPVFEWGSPGFESVVKSADVLVDAVLGTGLLGEPRGAVREAIELVNGARKPVVAVDVPSGFGTMAAVRPSLTVTFHDVKTGMDEKNSGEIVVEPIGIPEKASTHLGPGDLAAFYPRPDPASHKGTNGRVLIVGGGPYAGAPGLAGLAAVRCGADLVHVATPANVAPTIQAWSPAYIVHALPGERFASTHAPVLAKLLETVDALLIGPGLGDDKETLAATRKACSMAREEDVALVVDADAFKALALDTKSLDGHRAVVTPHAREFQTLTGLELPHEPEARARIAKQWARDHDVTVLLKGPVDVVTDGRQVKFNDVHHVAMTHGGTGDVLAGLVTCLLAKNVEPFRAARAACFLNGYAGVKAAARRSYGMSATDLVEAVPEVLREVLK